MDTVQANLHNEDRCQLVSGNLTDNADGPHGVFVGVYDGHGGATCSQFVLENLFNNLKTAIANQDAVNYPAAIKDAYEDTENTFVQFVRNNWHQRVELARAGSCCLVGLVHNNVLYVANAGDSRAVLAREPEGGPLEVVQLSTDYNANDNAIRDEVLAEHPDYNANEIFQHVGGTWRVRGILQLTRAIGDVYLKYNEFNSDPLPAQYRRQPFRPILTAVPTIQTYELSPNDRFVIFASDGLWDEMGNAEAAEIVKNAPDRSGAAAVLIRRALEKKAGKIGMQYEFLTCIRPSKYRRFFHDDISVVVLFFDRPAPVPGTGTETEPAPAVAAAAAPEAEASMNRVQEQSNSGAATDVLEDSLPSESISGAAAEAQN